MNFHPSKAYIMLCWCRGLKNILRLSIKKANCSEWEQVKMPSRLVIDIIQHPKHATTKIFKNHWTIHYSCDTLPLHMWILCSLGMNLWHSYLYLYFLWSYLHHYMTFEAFRNSTRTLDEVLFVWFQLWSLHLISPKWTVAIILWLAR